LSKAWTLSEAVEKGPAFEQILHLGYGFSFLSNPVVQAVKLFSISPIISFKNRQLCVIWRVV
jgi:hypothetical protein